MKKFMYLALAVTPVTSFVPLTGPTSSFRSALLMSDSNSDMFGAAPKSSSDSVAQPSQPSGAASNAAKSMKDQAAILRREAAELEIAMREEAREKGLPQEVIDKLIPLRSQTTTAPKASNPSSAATAVLDAPPIVAQKSSSEIRSKLGYLNSGDAVRFYSELERIKSKGSIRLWNSKDVSRASFAANVLQLTSKTGIEPVSLRLDAVGFEYQKVLGIAVILATVCALGSSFIGGQVGFLLGYASALFPILLVGIGSIAPELIGVVLNKFKFATDPVAKAKFARGNAAKFLVGYILGLPVEQFRVGGDSNAVDFFQIKPSISGAANNDGKPAQAFAKKVFKQTDIAPISVACVAGPTAECMEYKVAGGTSPGDVNLLYGLLTSVEPSLSPDKAEGHVRWAVLTAHEILIAHKKELDKLTEAFANGTPLEECIAILEGKE